MSTYYYAKDFKGDYLFDNFPSELKYLTANFRNSPTPFEINIDGAKRLARLGKKINEHGTIYTLTTEEKYIRRDKFFRELVDFSTMVLKPLINFQNALVSSQSSL